jgi:hypothetical protein
MSLYVFKLYADPACCTNDYGYLRLEYVIRLSPEELVALNMTMREFEAQYRAKYKKNDTFSWSLLPADVAAKTFVDFETDTVKSIQYNLCLGPEYT